MSKALWFVIGLFAGELAGRWLTHIVYATIILCLVIGKWPLLLLPIGITSPFCK